MNSAKITLSRFSTWARLPLASLSLLVLAAPVQALELGQTSTRAAYVVPDEDSGASYIDFSANAELSGIETVADDIITTWEIAGGIEPTPFRLVIPAECFQLEDASLQVRYFRSCGVKAVLESAEFGEVGLPIQAFTAVVTERRGSARLSITAAIDGNTEAGDLTAVILGTIGGGKQTVSIGRASAARLPSGIEVFGFDPQPEPPARGGRY